MTWEEKIFKAGFDTEIGMLTSMQQGKLWELLHSFRSFAM